MNLIRLNYIWNCKPMDLLFRMLTDYISSNTRHLPIWIDGVYLNTDPPVVHISVFFIKEELYELYE